MLKKAEHREVVLYTLDKGALPAYMIHFYCEGTLCAIATLANVTCHYQDAVSTITTTFVSRTVNAFTTIEFSI
jgi:hypothetical protein